MTIKADTRKPVTAIDSRPRDCGRSQGHELLTALAAGHINDLADFRPIIAAEDVPKACADIDAEGWQWFRKVALGFLGRSREDLVEQMRDNPDLTASLFELISHSERHAEQLQQWSEAMQVVHARAQELSRTLGLHMDKAGRA